MTTAAQIAAAYPAAAPVADALVALANQLGTDPAWLANVIQFESGWNPKARNGKSGATGLLQFMPNTAKRLGTSTDALLGMTVGQQMVYVGAYFRPYQGRLTRQEDVFMAVFYPAAVGKGPSFTFPEAVTENNPGIFTAGDYTRKALRRAKLDGSAPTTFTALAPVPDSRPSGVGRGARALGPWQRRQRVLRWVYGGGALFFTAVLVGVVWAKRKGV